MQHDRGTHARAGVGGTGGKIPQLGIKAEGAYRLQTSFHAESHVRRGFQIQARPNGLNAQVILLVDHDAHAAVLPDQRGAGFGPLHKVAADQVLFHQLEPLDIGQIAHEVQVIVFFPAAESGLRPLNAQPGIFRPVPVEEGKIKIVSGKPHPAGNDHIDRRIAHGCAAPLSSASFRSSSRYFAASSKFSLATASSIFWRSSLTRAARSSSGEGLKAAGLRPACCARP